MSLDISVPSDSKPLRKTLTSLEKDPEEISQYDPHKFPADIKLAQLHGKAKRVYKLKQTDLGGKICPCCGLSAENEELIPLCADTSQVSYLGSAYPLYFELTRETIYMMLIPFIISGIYSIITNTMYNGCSQNYEPNNEEDYYCIQDIVATFTIANKRNKITPIKIQYVLDCLSVFLLSIYYYRLRVYFRSLIKITDGNITKPSDYTIQIDGLPMEANNPLSTDQGLKQWIESKSTAELSLHVMKINRSYQISSYILLLETTDELVSKFETCIDEKKKLKLKQELEKNQEEIKRIDIEHFPIGKTAFVSMETAQQAEYMVQQHRLGWMRRACNKIKFKKVMEISKAPEPSDILWENLYPNLCKKYLAKAISTITKLSLIAISFGIIVILSEYQFETAASQSFTSQFFNLILGVFMGIFDPFLCWVILELTRKELHSTKTNEVTDASRGCYIEKFANNALTLVLAKVVMAGKFSARFGKNFKSSYLQYVNSLNFYGSFGINENTYWIIVANAFSEALGIYFDPFIWYDRYQRKKIIQQGDNNQLTQKQAHDLFQDPEFEIEQKYGFVTSGLNLTMLYSAAMPMGTLLSILGTISFYWITKYLLLRRTTFPPWIGSKIVEEMLETLKWAPFFYGLGMLITALTLNTTGENVLYQSMPLPLCIFGIVVGIIVLIVPADKFLEKSSKLVEVIKTTTKTYNEAKSEFISDYDLENPATKREAISKLQETMRATAKSREIDNERLDKAITKYKNPFQQYILAKTNTQHCRLTEAQGGEKFQKLRVKYEKNI